MKNVRKYAVVAVFLAIFLLPNFASAQTMEELQNKIADLLKQLAQLQAQIAQMQGTTAQWCHDFSTDLKIGMGGSEVEALQVVLDREGFSINTGEKNDKRFDESTASAVSGLQQKYEGEILAPLGLKYPTGYVGKATRAKLSSIYGCAVKSTTPSGTTQAPVPTTLKPETSPSAVGTSTRKFRPIDPSRCPGIIETSCTIEPANIIKVSVYDEKGGFVDTRENNNSGMAGFLNLPYGNYTVVINAEGFEYYKASFTVCATCEAITTIYLKKISTPSTPHSITVLDPNGGNKYLKGATYTTTWSSSGVNTVYIKLRKGNDTYPGPEGMISDIILNRGSYQWTVPTTLPDGDDYWFVVLDGTYGGPMDSSDAPFSIVASPGGRTLPVDQLANILESAQGILYQLLEILKSR